MTFSWKPITDNDQLCFQLYRCCIDIEGMSKFFYWDMYFWGLSIDICSQRYSSLGLGAQMDRLVPAQGRSCTSVLTHIGDRKWLYCWLDSNHATLYFSFNVVGWYQFSHTWADTFIHTFMYGISGFSISSKILMISIFWSGTSSQNFPKKINLLYKCQCQ